MAGLSATFPEGHRSTHAFLVQLESTSSARASRRMQQRWPFWGQSRTCYSEKAQPWAPSSLNESQSSRSPSGTMLIAQVFGFLTEARVGVVSLSVAPAPVLLVRDVLHGKGGKYGCIYLLPPNSSRIRTHRPGPTLEGFVGDSPPASGGQQLRKSQCTAQGHGGRMEENTEQGLLLRFCSCPMLPKSMALCAARCARIATGLRTLASAEACNA